MGTAAWLGKVSALHPKVAVGQESKEEGEGAENLAAG